MTPADKTSMVTLRRMVRVLQLAFAGFLRDGCFHLAAAIAYFALLSFIPLAVLLLSFLTIVVRSSQNLTDLFFEAVQTYFPVIPPAFIQQVGDLVNHAGALGGTASIFLLITATMMFEAVQNGLNRVFGSQKSTFVRSRLVTLGLALGVALTTCFLLGLIVVLTAVTATIGNLIEGLGPLDVAATIVYKFAITYAVPLLVTITVFLVTIKGVPNKHVRFEPALIGAVFGAILWEVAKRLFTWYVSTVAPYHIIYGSLGALVIGLLWIQYSASLLLLSAELTAVLNDEAEGRGAGESARSGGQPRKRG